VLGEPNKAAQLARLQRDYQPGAQDASLKSSYKSRVSQKTTNSKTAAIVEQLATLDAAQAEASPAYSNKLVEELIGTLQVCNMCSNSLTEDERIINARFIQQAASNGQDISMFPICVKCNFDNLLKQSSSARQAKRDGDELGVKGFVPTAKKFYNSTMFQNSKEFTQLGTLAKDGRTAEYYQPEIPAQPKPLQDVNDLSYLNTKKVHPIGSQLRNENLEV